MKRQGIWKRWQSICAAAVLAAVLSGCMIVSSPEDLYRLPQLPEEYVELEKEISTLLAAGHEYAAPTEGENIQPIQMVDIDHDGVDEALVFLRKAGDLQPQKIYIFKNIGERFQYAAVIQESASSISRIDYADLNQDGYEDLVIGWNTMTASTANSTDERTLGRVVYVYNMERFACERVLAASYNKYVTADLNRDGTQELLAIGSDSSGSCKATLYEWKQGTVEPACSVKLSMVPTMLSEVTLGGLKGGGEGLFITGTVDEETLVTDLLVWNDDTLVNCTLDPKTGSSSLIYHNSTLQTRDIDGDGALEVPVPYELPRGEGEDAVRWAINWTAYSARGEAYVAETTFHNLTDGWYLVLPESWKKTISITNVTSSTGERAVTFGLWREGEEEPLNIVTIYTETGDSREYKASQGNRFILARQISTIYAAELLPGSEGWEGTMTQDALKAAFRLIRTEWND